MRPLRFAPLAIAIACGDAMSPHQMSLTFEPSRITGVGERLAEGRFACPVDAVIQAHGGAPGDSLLLLEIISTFYDASGVKGNTMFAAPLDWFGINRLGHDQRMVAHRTANGPGPFSVQIDLRYGDLDGVYHVERLTAECR